MSLLALKATARSYTHKMANKPPTTLRSATHATCSGWGHETGRQAMSSQENPLLDTDVAQKRAMARNDADTRWAGAGYAPVSHAVQATTAMTSTQSVAAVCADLGT